MASLVFLAGPIAGRRYKLHEADEYVIGRRSDCQIFVPDMRVSRQHARLVREAEGGWRLEDLGSNNGTFINGSRVQGTATLENEDEILIASNKIRVDTADRPSESLPLAEKQVTIVGDTGQALIRAREDRHPLVSSGLVSISDQKAVRLIERKLEALTQILHATAHSETEDVLLEKVAEALLALFPQAADVGVLVDDEKTHELRINVQRHRASITSELRVPATIIAHVVSDRRGVLLGEAADEGEHIGARMGAPLLYHGTHYGVVYVESKTQSFRQEDVDLLQTIATQTGLAMHAARVAEQLSRRERLERDLRVARQIQRSLLPANPPEVAGLDFAVHYEPAYQIGGDFYDFIWHDPTHLGLAVGDVAGKAISAALYMARVTSELRSRAAIARTPSRLLERVNREVASLGDDGMFATLVYCIYDLETHALVFTNAGHCVPLLRRGARVFPLQAERAHTPPLGITAELAAGEARVQLEPGDMLILVSDGILEARDARGVEYGLARLSRRIRTAQGSADDVVKAILADIDGHAAEGSQGDDMTIVAMALDTLDLAGRPRRTPPRSPTIPGGSPTGHAPLDELSAEDPS